MPVKSEKKITVVRRNNPHVSCTPKTNWSQGLHAPRRPLYKFLLPTKHIDRNTFTHHCITLPQNTHSERVKHPTEDASTPARWSPVASGKGDNGMTGPINPSPTHGLHMPKVLPLSEAMDSTILMATKFDWALHVSFDRTGTYLAVSCPSLPPQY